MINDYDTNVLYIADTLSRMYPQFYGQFKKILNNVPVRLLEIPKTKDVWAVDYMPIQVGINTFIQFRYNPDYLNYKGGSKTISDVNSICENIKLKTIKSNIVLDGGNVIRGHNTVIMCDKVFKENQAITPKVLRKELEILFEVDRIVFIPTHPKDFAGHADGMVRFLDSQTVLINDYSKEPSEFRLAFYLALSNARYDTVPIPYNPYKNKSYYQINGEYINFLQMKNLIVLPVYGMKEDEITVQQFERLFPCSEIQIVNCDAIANNGGGLNCITWNIKI